MSNVKCQMSNVKYGQSLIEVIIAFGVTVVLGVALISAGLVTQRSAASARNNAQATKLAEEYIEQVRVIRDVKTFSTTSIPSSGCFTVTSTSASDPSTWGLSANCASGAAPCDQPIATSRMNGEKLSLNKADFCRRITLSAGPTAASRKVKVEVTWKEGVNELNVTNNTLISDWCEGDITGTGAACPP